MFAIIFRIPMGFFSLPIRGLACCRRFSCITFSMCFQFVCHSSSAFVFLHFFLFHLDQFEHYFVFTSFIHPHRSFFLANNTLNLFINLCVNLFLCFFTLCILQSRLSSHHFSSLAILFSSYSSSSFSFVLSTESCKSK